MQCNEQGHGSRRRGRRRYCLGSCLSGRRFASLGMAFILLEQNSHSHPIQPSPKTMFFTTDKYLQLDRQKTTSFWAEMGCVAEKVRTAQHSTAQHSTAQHSTAQHSTAQICLLDSNTRGQCACLLSVFNHHQAVGTPSNGCYGGLFLLSRSPEKIPIREGNCHIGYALSVVHVKDLRSCSP